MFYVLAILLVFVGHLSGQQTGNVTEPEFEERIVNGLECSIQDTPFIVAVLIDNDGVPSLCGGSLIAEDWVLTAGHCVQPELIGDTVEITIRAGSSSFKKGGQTRIAKRVIRHPEYNGETYRHDLALLQTNEKFILGENLTLAPLVNKTNKGFSNSCKSATISGWGATFYKQEYRDLTPYLMCVEVDLVQGSNCTSSLQDLIRDKNYIYAFMTNASKSACTGDSGGPLICDGFLIGTISGGTRCGAPGTCGIFANIESHFDFIKNYTKLDLPNWKPTDKEYIA